MAPRTPSNYSLGADASAEVAAIIEARMEKRGENQTTIAKKMDEPQGHISNLLRGAKRFQQWQVLAFAAALECKETDLLPQGLSVAKLVEPAAMSVQERTMEASKEDFIARLHPAQLSDDDVRFLRESRLRIEDDDKFDDDYWWGIVGWHRKRLERRRDPAPVAAPERPGPARPGGRGAGRR